MPLPIDAPPPRSTKAGRPPSRARVGGCVMTVPASPPHAPSSARSWSQAAVTRGILLAFGAVVALLFLGAWVTGRSDLGAINLYLLTPLLGGLLGLTRLAPPRRVPRELLTIVYLLMCL